MGIWTEEILASPYIKYLIMEVEYTISQFLEIWPEIHHIWETLYMDVWSKVNYSCQSLYEHLAKCKLIILLLYGHLAKCKLFLSVICEHFARCKLFLSVLREHLAGRWLLVY